MRNSSNVITLKDRQQSCVSCLFRHDCLVGSNPSSAGAGRGEFPVSGCVVRRGAHIFRMGERFDALYRVRSGAVKTYWLGSDGEQQVTGFYLPGEIVGLDSISTESYVSSAVALDTSGVCTLPYGHLQRACRSSEDNMARLMSRLSNRIRESEEAFIVLGHKTADERMAWFLTNLLRRQAKLGFASDEINLPMTRTDIGSYLMLAVETVSRVLTRLQGNRVISVRRNRIGIDSIEKLEELATSSNFEATPPSRRAITSAATGGRETRPAPALPRAIH